MTKYLMYVEGCKIYVSEKEYKKCLKDWGYSKEEIKEKMEKVPQYEYDEYDVERFF